jgi:hypothetical protein
MIHHLSIAARDPQHVAEVLAEFMGGAATRFTPNPGSWFAHQHDEYGTGVEVYPAGTELRPAGPEGASFAMISPTRDRIIVKIFVRRLGIVGGLDCGRLLAAREASAPSQPRPPKVAPPMAWDEAAGLILSTGPRYWRFVAAGSHFTASLWLAITGTRPPTA